MRTKNSLNRMKIGVVGLGQIGGSIARCCLILGHRVVGVDTNQESQSLAEIDGLSPCKDLLDLCKEASVIFLCVSLEKNFEILNKLINICEKLHLAPTITDVASYKSHTFNTDKHPGFLIPGHPMAGTHGFGYASSNPELFNGAQWVLIVSENSDFIKSANLISLINEMGALVQIASSEWHDQSVSLISALPHVMAATLSSVAVESDRDGKKLTLAAGSFRSGTRVMSSNPRFIRELLFLNRDTLLPLLDLAVSRLNSIKRDIENKDHESFDKLLVGLNDQATRLFSGSNRSGLIRADEKTLMPKLISIKNTGICIEKTQIEDSSWTFTIKVASEEIYT